MLFYLDNLQLSRKYVSLHCVFHSIRFKVNKGWSTAVLLFLLCAQHTIKMGKLKPSHSVNVL